MVPVIEIAAEKVDRAVRLLDILNFAAQAMKPGTADLDAIREQAWTVSLVLHELSRELHAAAQPPA